LFRIDLLPAKIEHIRQDQPNQPAVISKVQLLNEFQFQNWESVD